MMPHPKRATPHRTHAMPHRTHAMPPLTHAMPSLNRAMLQLALVIALSACLMIPSSSAAAQDLAPARASAPSQELRLDDMSAFAAPPANWQIRGSVNADPDVEHHLEGTAGTGVLANFPREGAEGNLTTRLEHGDLILELDYLMPNGSNSGIYLQGRYEIQLLDSWGVEDPTYGAAAGIYQRWDESKPEGEKGYEGHPPRVNASLAPGLWQHLRIEFLAPTFDDAGRKTANAVVRRIVHNGVVVHENVALTGPTRGPALNGEAARGPIVIQGDHGPIAFKNVRYDLDVPPDTARTVPEAQPVLVEVGPEPILIRSMAEHGSRKITHALSVGFPEGVHYSIDLASGALFRVWRGPFADATEMWYSRGIDQTLEPLGAEVELDSRPPVGGLDAEGHLRSDSTAYRFKGYEIRDDGRPVMMYDVGSIHVSDDIGPSEDGRSLVREMIFRAESDPSDIWVQVASADEITRAGEHRFVVGDRAYYVELDESVADGVYIDDGPAGNALIVPVGESGLVKYRLIW